MYAEIKITDKDIEYAESILLAEGQTFKDDGGERIEFIKNLDTIDLHAVPGSGKTTALMAKLLILERKLPFEDGSGILAISHTNTAVDEIKNKIEDYCPKLFSYPNFVGTIQSFVNKFLARPYYNQRMKSKINRIDDDLYNELINKFNNYYLEGFNSKQQKNTKYFLNYYGVVTKYRLDENNKLVESINGKELEIKTPKNKKNDWSLTEKNQIKKWLKKLKLKIMKSGILCFDDAYYLANRYMLEYPKVKKLLQKRFAYVFVDEMQDMALHQYKILEGIFYSTGNSESKYQQIGDRNQAIYNGGNNFRLNKIWQARENELEITTSYRFSKKIADVLKNFAFDDVDIKSINDDQVKIKPYLLVYNDKNCQCKVIQKFIEIIKRFQEKGQIPVDLQYPLKAVSWVTKEKEGNKISLPDYCPEFNKEKSKNKINYRSLESYLFNSNDNYKEIYNNLLNTILKVLRLEEIKNEDNNRFYTKKSLFWYLKNHKIREYEKLKLKLYKWSTRVINKEILDVISDVKDYIKEFLLIFDKEISKASEFINKKIEIKKEDHSESKNQLNCDLCKLNNKKVELNSVHSVKGETHAATLYLESFYNKKYETDFIKNMILGDSLTEEIKRIEMEITELQDKIDELEGQRGTKTKKKKVNKYKRYIKNLKKYSRMVYVGFSRPVYLLAFAVHEKKYNEYLSEIDEDVWEVEKVLIG
jgi:hypothetical protein